MPTYDLREAPLALFYACSVHVRCILIRYALSPNPTPRATYYLVPPHHSNQYIRSDSEYSPTPTVL